MFFSIDNCSSIGGIVNNPIVVMKVLVIHFGNKAQIIFSTVLIRALKVQLEAELTVLTGYNGITALADNPYIDHLIPFKGLIRTARKLRPVHYDYIIDLNNNDKSTVSRLFLRGKKLVFNRNRIATYFLKRFKINRLKPINLAEQYFNTCKSLPIKMDEMRLDVFIAYKNEVPLEWLPPAFGKNYVVFCISAPALTRKLPLNRIIEVCDKINKPIILLGEKDDEQKGRLIDDFFHRHESAEKFEDGLKALNKKTIIYNAIGKFNFQQEASIIRKSSHVFTFDNDYLPVASAFGRETFCIYGSTVLAFGRYPYQTRFTVLERHDLSCRPCSAEGNQKCPLAHFKCMREINFDFYLM